MKVKKRIKKYLGKYGEPREIEGLKKEVKQIFKELSNELERVEKEIDKKLDEIEKRSNEYGFMTEEAPKQINSLIDYLEKVEDVLYSFEVLEEKDLVEELARGRRKIGEGEIYKILGMYKKGYNLTQISRELNLSTSTVWRIIREYEKKKGRKNYDSNRENLNSIVEEQTSKELDVEEKVYREIKKEIEEDLALNGKSQITSQTIIIKMKMHGEKTFTFSQARKILKEYEKRLKEEGYVTKLYKGKLEVYAG